MSGLTGAITEASQEYNRIDKNDTKEGMKLAATSYRRTMERKKEMAKQENINKQVQEIDSKQLAKDIEDDIMR